MSYAGLGQFGFFDVEGETQQLYDLAQQLCAQAGETAGPGSVNQCKAAQFSNAQTPWSKAAEELFFERLKAGEPIEPLAVSVSQKVMAIPGYLSGDTGRLYLNRVIENAGKRISGPVSKSAFVMATGVKLFPDQPAGTSVDQQPSKGGKVAFPQISPAFLQPKSQNDASEQTTEEGAEETAPEEDSKQSNRVLWGALVLGGLGLAFYLGQRRK